MDQISTIVAGWGEQHDEEYQLDDCPDSGFYYSSFCSILPQLDTGPIDGG